MLLYFNLVKTFDKLLVKFNDYPSFLDKSELEKYNIIKELWGKVDKSKKDILSTIISDNLIINNDYFWTIPLNTIYYEYKNYLNKNKINILYADPNEIKDDDICINEKVNIYLTFNYNEIDPSQDIIDRTLFNFISSIILWYNINSINNYKIMNLLMFQEQDSDFTIYNVKSPFNNIKEYLSLLNFISWWIKFNTDLLSKILLKNNTKIQNKIINKLILQKNIDFNSFVKITWINKELILSQELWTLIYNIDLTDNNFNSKKEIYKTKLWIEKDQDLFYMLYLYLYVNFK